MSTPNFGSRNGIYYGEYATNDLVNGLLVSGNDIAAQGSGTDIDIVITPKGSGKTIINNIQISGTVDFDGYGITNIGEIQGSSPSLVIKTDNAGAANLALAAYNTSSMLDIVFAMLTSGNPPTMDLADSVTKAGGYIYRAGGTDVALADGGTNASLIASSGGIFYSTSTSAAILAGTSTSSKVLLSGTSSAPSWSASTFPGTAGSPGTLIRATSGGQWGISAATWPNTITGNSVIYGDSGNSVSELVSTNSTFLTANASGVPTWGTSVNNDLSLTGTNSGATRTLTVANTSNSASSQAALVTSVGGSSAGDAYHQFVVNGQQTYTMGIDNSNGDFFSLSDGTALGTNDLMNIRPNGAVSFPQAYKFLAVLTNSVNSVTGNGAAYSVIYDTVIQNIGSGYSTVSGLFTAPVTGNYLFQFGIGMESLTSAMTLGAGQLVFSTGYSVNDMQLSWGGVRTSNNLTRLTGTYYTPMTAGDTCNVTITISNGASNSANITGTGGGTSYRNWFSGQWVP